MSLVTRYRLFWAALMAALLGLAFWKNSRSYPRKSRLWRLGKDAIDTGLVMLMVIYAPALLLACVAEDHEVVSPVNSGPRPLNAL